MKLIYLGGYGGKGREGVGKGMSDRSSSMEELLPCPAMLAEGGYRTYAGAMFPHIPDNRV